MTNKQLLKEIKKSFANPFNFHNFFILFPFLVGAILLLMISTVYLGTLFEACGGEELTLSGKLGQREGESHEFIYDDGGKCTLSLSANPSKDLSIWLYDPNKKIKVFEEVENSIQMSAVKGKYRVSVHNKGEKAVNYLLKVVIQNLSIKLANR